MSPLIVGKAAGFERPRKRESLMKAQAQAFSRDRIEGTGGIPY